VLPSYSENFGIAPVEAMACGMPVVISNQVGISHEVREAGAGIVVPCSSDRLSDALLLLLNNPEQHQQMATNAKQLVQQRFSLESTTEALMQLYSSVATLSQKEKSHEIPPVL
jgi:glycosyltransferase involved in cell wall biosynthesis